MLWCRTYTVQWSTEKAGDFLITAWLEECEVGGCAKACSVQVGYQKCTTLIDACLYTPSGH